MVNFTQTNLIYNNTVCES